MHSNQMRVRLGATCIKAFVAAPQAFHVLGVVRFGREYGLLATNASGLYFRVNGTQSEVLNSMDVRRAIAAAHSSHSEPAHSRPALAPLPAPHVTFRKHRTVQASA